jgi:hypothetical protein
MNERTNERTNEQTNERMNEKCVFPNRITIHSKKYGLCIFSLLSWFYLKLMLFLNYNHETFDFTILEYEYETHAPGFCGSLCYLNLSSVLLLFLYR